MSLINSTDRPSEFDAAAKLAEGEPYFLLIARDRLAPPLVRQWAEDNRQRALAEFSAGRIGEEKRDRELEKSRDAERISWDMEAFKAGDLAKRVAEEPTAKTYSGADVPEETKRRDAIQAARGRAFAALSNAVAELDQLDQLLHLPLPDHVPASLQGIARDTVAQLEAAAEMVAPPRPVADTSRDMEYTRIDQ